MPSLSIVGGAEKYLVPGESPVYSLRMPSDRLALALERLGPGEWLDFEKFAAEFLAVEYPSLRTMASPQGDKGRDGQLYLAEEEPRTAVQYSVTSDWPGKIRQTIKRLAETLPSVNRLIYVTNQVVGPAADDLVAALRRDKNMAVDVRDQSWFVERELTAPQRQVASSELARRYVDPLLQERGIRNEVGIALTQNDARIALLHLSLGAHDEATEKGLTKSCFESLVLAALHDSSTKNRISVDAIVARVELLLPAGYEQQVHGLVEGALGRLSSRRGRVKRHAETNDYCLSHAEITALKQRTASFLKDESALEHELVQAVSRSDQHERSSDELRVIGRDLRRAVETVLLRRGEAFATAARGGAMSVLDVAEVLQAVAEAGHSPANTLTEDEAAYALVEVLDRPSSAVQGHLRRQSDAYTLFAFLRQTPEVQKTVLTMFSEGDIWLDTSILLPLLAETLLDDPTERHYTTLMSAAIDAGLRLYVTDGVVEEVERHLNRCVAFARASTQEWRSSVPFFYRAYTLSGRARPEFVMWLEEFRGWTRPVEDIKEYFAEVFGIQGQNLLDYSDSAPLELRAAVQELWQAVHDRRRLREGDDFDPQAIARLVAHDVENTVGVMQLRTERQSSAFGHRFWWLTLDKTAFRLTRHLRDVLGQDAPPSPVLSPDFLTQLLRLGPLRTAVERDLRVNLPLLTGVSHLDFVPKELIDFADRLRVSHNDVSDRIVRRRIRDELDRARARLGPEAVAGARAAEERVADRLEIQGQVSLDLDDASS